MTPARPSRRPAHPRRGRSIFATLAAELLIAALVPMAIAVWLATYRTGEALAREAETSLSLLASTTATRLDQVLHGAAHALVQVAEDDRVAGLLTGRPPEEFDDVAARLQLTERSSDLILLAMVLDTEGNVVVTSNPDFPERRFNTRAYWSEAMSGRRYTSELRVGSVTGRHSVFTSAPIRHGDRIVGVAVLQLDAEPLRAIALSASPGGAAQAMLLSRNGVILAHTDRSLHFRRLGPMPNRVVEAIDPLADYGVARLDALPLAPLAAIACASTAGAAETDLPVAGGAAHGGKTEPWMIGYAPITMRPWTVAVMVPRSQFAAPLRGVVREQLVILALIAIAAGAYAFARARRIVRPLVSLTIAAERVADGDFNVRSRVRRGDEIGKLAKAFDTMVPRLREHVELCQSLEVAMDVQQALLHGGDPVISDLDIAGRSHSCDDTVGDYFDYVEVVHGRTLIVVGDVMGHGVASTLLMATARAAIRAHAALHTDLGELMTRVNWLLSENADHGRLMTMVIVTVDATDRTIRWASAGHDPITIFTPPDNTDAAPVIELAEGEVPLGVDPEQLYVEHSATLAPGAVLLVNTNGIWETMDQDGRMYGKERLQAVVREAIMDGRSSAEIVAAVDEDVSSFRGEAESLQDVTFVVVRLASQTAAAMSASQSGGAGAS